MARSMLENEIVVQALMKSTIDETSEFSDSSSTVNSLSDEEIIPKRRKLVRIPLYVEKIVVRYSNEEFKIHFRMARSTACRIIELLKSSKIIPSHTHGREKLSSEKSYLVTLWYLSNLETFRQVSDRFNISMSSVHRCLKRIIKFLLTIKSNFIKWPTGERITTITNAFKAKQGIEHVLGAIDGSHIEIQRPEINPEVYVNRKGYFSLLLQGVVNHEKKFLDVFCGEPGSMHDARLLRKSGLYAKILKNPDVMGEYFLLGDSAYPNLYWLVTPFKEYGALSKKQKLFNYKISSSRVIVENAFGLLKGRFRRLRHIDNLNLKLSAELIMVCCVLHNICLDMNDVIEADVTDYNQPELDQFKPHIHVNQQINRQLQVFNKIC